MNQIERTRRKRLKAVLEHNQVVPNMDYKWAQFYDENENFAPAVPVERFVAIYGDETYMGAAVCDSLTEARIVLEAQTGQETLGNPHYVIDLDRWEVHPVIGVTIKLGDTNPVGYTP
jgi:hypothetical protein